MDHTRHSLESFITKATLSTPHANMRGGFDAVRGVASQSTQQDTAFIDMIVEYNPLTQESFMMPRAPLDTRIALKDTTLEDALHVGAETLRIAFVEHGIALGRFVGAYPRADGVTTPKGIHRETYWMRFDL